MTRHCRPRPDRGFSMLHTHEAPFPGPTTVRHVHEAICMPEHVLDDHAHAAMEICYVYRGRATRVVDGRPAMVGPGDFFLIRPGEAHAAYADPRDPYHYFALCLEPRDLAARTLGPDMPLAGFARGAPSVPHVSAHPPAAGASCILRGGRGAERIFRRIIGELDHLDASDAVRRCLTFDMVQALVVELLVFISRLGSPGGLITKEPDGHDRVRPAFSELLHWLESRRADPPALTAMAARVHLSPAHFVSAFRREIGLTPMAYLLQRRIDLASQRLREDPRRSVTAIALDLGFCSSQHFSVVFKKCTGYTPRTWRMLEC